MKLPEYWLQCPQMAINPSDQEQFDQIIATAIENSDGSQIEYSLTAPKWQFLNYLVNKHDIVLHGSGNQNIARFEPRKAADLNEFGSQEAVYAAADGIWAMFFAIVDRDNFPMLVSNACIQFVDGDKLLSEPLYVFSLSQGMLQKRPWRTGYIYLLPAETFVKQPTIQFGAYSVQIKQQASLVEVNPIAKLAVGPEDFPFLDQIREHDDDRIAEYAQAMQTGGPWPAK